MSSLVKILLIGAKMRFIDLLCKIIRPILSFFVIQIQGEVIIWKTPFEILDSFWAHICQGFDLDGEFKLAIFKFWELNLTTILDPCIQIKNQSFHGHVTEFEFDTFVKACHFGKVARMLAGDFSKIYTVLKFTIDD